MGPYCRTIPPCQFRPHSEKRQTVKEQSLLLPDKRSRKVTGLSLTCRSNIVLRGHSVPRNVLMDWRDLSVQNKKEEKKYYTRVWMLLLGLCVHVCIRYRTSFHRWFQHSLWPLPTFKTAIQFFVWHFTSWWCMTYPVWLLTWLKCDRVGGYKQVQKGF